MHFCDKTESMLRVLEVKRKFSLFPQLSRLFEAYETLRNASVVPSDKKVLITAWRSPITIASDLGDGNEAVLSTVVNGNK